MKATGRLVKALIALIASVVLCIGVCLAWFSMNGEVDANGMNSNIKSRNIHEFTVAAYELERDKDDENKYSVGNGVTGTEVTMSEYGGIGNDKTTALLLEFTYSFEEVLNKDYYVYAECKNARVAVSLKQESADLCLECSLSSVVSFYGIGENEQPLTTRVVTQSAEKEEKDMPGNDNGSLVTLNPAEITDAKGMTQVKFYCIIDYNDDKISEQLRQALNIEGTTPFTPMDFVNDMDFYMSEI